MLYRDEMPTAQFIDDYYAHLDGLWNKSRSKWKVVDEYYNRTFPLWRLDQPRPIYRPSTARNLIDHAVDTQLAYDAVVRRQPGGESEGAKDKANRVEEAMIALLFDAALQDLMLTWKQVGRHLLTYGYSSVEGPLWKKYMDMDKPRKQQSEKKEQFEVRMEEYEDERRGWNPVRIRAPHPSSILMDPMEKQPKLAIKVNQWFAGELERHSTYKKKIRAHADIYQRGDLKPYDTVKTVELFTPRWHTLKVQGEKNNIYTEANLSGFVPFTHGYAGFGMELTDAKEMDPSYLAVGLLDHVMDSIKVQAQRMTAEHNAMIEASFTRRGYDGDTAEGVQSLRNAEGGGVMPGEKEDWWILDSPHIERWFFQVGRNVDADIEAGTYIPSLRGAREEGVTTVGQQVILSTAAARKFAAPARQLEHMATITVSRILRLVAQMGETIRVGGFELRPSDIGKNFNIQVAFEIIDPILQLQKREMGLKEVLAGGKSWETYYEEDANLENVTREIDRLNQQRVREHPIVVALTAATTARAMGNEESGQVFDQQVQQLLSEADQSLDITRSITEQGTNDAIPPIPNGATPSIPNENPLADLANREGLGTDAVRPQPRDLR